MSWHNNSRTELIENIPSAPVAMQIMLCHCPFARPHICSRISSYPEVGGGANLNPRSSCRHQQFVSHPMTLCTFSRLPFRTLVRKYDCDFAFTPMIMANSFVRSSKARDSEFTTNKGEFLLHR